MRRKLTAEELREHHRVSNRAYMAKRRQAVKRAVETSPQVVAMRRIVVRGGMMDSAGLIDRLASSPHRAA